MKQQETKLTEMDCFRELERMCRIAVYSKVETSDENGGGVRRFRVY